MPPAKSQAQRGFIYSQFGKNFAKEHHFDNPGKLPQYVPGSEAKKAKQKQQPKK